MNVDKDLLRDLAELLNDTDLSEIEVTDGEKRIKVSRSINHITASVPSATVPATAAIAPTAQPAAVENAPTEQNDFANHPGAVTSPMVGTVYLAPEPGADDFISVGDKVTSGQTLMIVEAMKVMNQIPATKSGVVKHILIENGQPIEFGEPLVIIE
ncbi:MAG: acetyl-CoA carboxylase, biotin carboxyl carrier protein [Kordiimonas sp.]|nr:acetyl-CoA carboxylase, biotin carboxyl carrier protein [Kordiimonas sp.]